MKTKLFLMVTVLFMGVFVLPTQASIHDVLIQPANPTFSDDISVLVFGEESGSMGIVDSILTMEDMSIELDIYIELGFSPVVTPWTHSENIGMLSIGTYDIMVNMLVDTRPDLNDTFTTSFEVVPEPATVLLVSTGVLYIRRKKRTSSKK
jgi:hypothetical protein